MTGIKYEVVRSGRKTTAIEVKRDGSVVVRAPWLMPPHSIERFVREKQDWIIKAQEKVLSRATRAVSADEIKMLTERAKIVLPPRAKYYARLVGVTYGRITVRHQKTKWGSCSSKGNLNFNCMLMTLPQRVIDYVIVHELCHLKQMNHSPAFWAEVKKIFPDYKELRKQLKDIPI